MNENKMRDIVKDNEGLNNILNIIVDYEIDKVIDEMITTVNNWGEHTDVISCKAVISMLQAHKSE